MPCFYRISFNYHLLILVCNKYTGAGALSKPMMSQLSCTYVYLIHFGLGYHVVTQNFVNIGSGNGLLPNDTKPLPKPMLTYHK